MTSSSSSSSSSMSRRNYGVFLSFRGPDTRHTIVSHLYNSLTNKGVYVFKDNEELEAGQKRSELFDAIEGTRVAIIVFSKYYARSKWCLDELQKIMECKDRGNLTVIPLFYQVTPGEVRLHPKDSVGKGCYQMAIEEMEETYGKDSETVKRWRKALWQGGDLIGFPLDQGQDEGIVVRDVVERVLRTLNRVSLEVTKYPVGIGHHIKAMRPLLRIDPHVEDVCMIGIHGQGGAGKTTLSKAICNEIADKFDSWCFLPNVRETTSRDWKGLAQLQEALLRDMLSDKGLTVSSVDAGKRLIKDRLCNKRVLVILDDVDQGNQLEALAGDLNWFGKGSRIILTTRNEHVLTSYGVQVHKLNLLKKEEAEHLFRLHAFGETQEKINVDVDLINRFVEYAGGLPLALVVLGAFLRGRREREWEWKLKELNLRPDRDINSFLKVSFDALEESHKEMFLDVACFYRGWDIKSVEEILDSCWNSSSLGMAILIERCLVTVVDERVQMHDLLVEMGQSIARDGGVISRIWSYKDFVDIMSEDRVQERKAVKGIIVDEFMEIREKVIVKSNSLMDFKTLRVFIFIPLAVRDDNGPLRLPRELRWFTWEKCGAPSIEFDPYSKLVHFNLFYTDVRQIKAKEGLEELRFIDMSYCYSLETLPDLSRSRKLETLKLDYCDRLTGLDEAIGSLENLIHLDLNRCGNLLTVPSSLRSERLKTLDFSYCLKLKKMPAIMEEQKFLEVLNITNTAIKELPDSIRNLVALKELVSWNCEELNNIPSSIYEMRALEKIVFSGCRKLSAFPRNNHAKAATDVLGFPSLVSLSLGDCGLKELEFLNDFTCFDTLKELILGGNKFTHVPAIVSKFKNLKELWLARCNQLVEVMELPNVPNLRLANCPLLKIFPSLHTFISRSPESFYLDLSNCHSLDYGYIKRSLPLEDVRRFVGLINVIYPGEEFPKWVKFQEEVSCHSLRYRVSLPPDTPRDDLFGLALFISFNPKWEDHRSLHVWVNDVRFRGLDLFHEVGGVHSLFFYIPGQQIVPRDRRIDVDGHYIFLKLDALNVELCRLGMRLLCKREEDDHMINVRKVGDDESDSSGSEYESAIECISDVDPIKASKVGDDVSDFSGSEYDSAIEWDCEV